MKITISKSLYNHIETRKIIMENNYESFGSSKLESTEEGTVTAEVFVKKKIKEPVYWQYLIKELVKESEKENIEELIPKKYSNFDVIVIFNIPDTSELYFTNFGQAFNDINKFIDVNFGIQFAEKSIRKRDVTSKKVAYFKQNRLREITNFRRNISNNFRASESYTSLTGYPESKERFGNTVDCSSGVSFNVSGDPLNFKKNLVDLLLNIHELMQIKDKLNSFPRLEIIRENELINDLDNQMFEHIKKLINGEETGNEEIFITRIFEHNNRIVILDQIEKAYIYKKGLKSKTKKIFMESQLSFIDIIMEFIISNDIMNIEDIYIELHESDRKSYVSIKKLLHFEINKENRQYLLLDGYWGEFNNDFIELIDESLSSIVINFNKLSFNESFNGTEDDYIQKLEEANGDDFKVLHKKFVRASNPNTIMKGTGIELADIYNTSSNEILAIKNGVDTTKSIYSIEQSILGISTLIEKNDFDFSDIIDVLGNTHFEKLNSVNYNGLIWLLPLNQGDGLPIKDVTHTNNVKNKRFKLQDLGSILLKSKLVEWAEFSRENRFEPVIYLETPTQHKSIENSK